MTRKTLLWCIALGVSGVIHIACGSPPEQSSPAGSDTTVPYFMTLTWETGGLAAPESALYDALREVIYVSCVNGNPDEKNGLGYIARLDADGTLKDLQWIGGLNAPKGLGRSNNSLYVADIDRVLEFDIDSRALQHEWPVPGARFLNDIAVGPDGALYVADTIANTIHRIRGGELTLLASGPELESPNGLWVDGDNLLVASWGLISDPATWAAKTPGRVLKIDLAADPAVLVPFGDGAPIGNLDGIVANGAGSYYASDWAQSGLFQIDQLSGEAALLQPLPRGSADIGVIPGKRILLVPVMTEGKIQALNY